VRLTRWIWIALGVSLLTGLVIGTVIRQRMERPTRYIGLAVPPHPGHVGHAGPPVLHPCEGEEQV
jgi:hypothetical protein